MHNTIIELHNFSYQNLVKMMIFFAKNQSKNPRKCLARLGCLSLRSAFASI